jgi:hypothetical protein
MAEYILGDDEDQAAVAAELLANADDPNDVVWRPRSNLGAHAGVYEAPAPADEPPAEEPAADEPPAEDASGSSGAARKSRRKTAAGDGGETQE